VIDRLGWRTMFLALGAAGLLIALPTVLRYLRDDGPLTRPATGTLTQAALDAFRLPDYWLAMTGGILSNVILYGLLAWLPTYLAEGRHVDFANLAGSTSAPYWLGAVAIPIWAMIGDATNKRAWLASLGCGVAAIATYFASQSPTLGVTVALLAVSVFFQNAYQTAEFPFVQRILPPERVGAATGLYNGLAVIVGAGGGTWLVGKVVETTGSYDAGLAVVVIAGLVNSLVLAVLARRIKY
jgi:sugar phosphate permease